MAANIAVVLFAVLALAAAAEQSRVKKQVIVGAYPYAAAHAPVVYAEDDGSWAPGKYDPIAVPAAYPYAAAIPAAAAAIPATAAYPYSAYPYAAAAYPYSGYPYAAAAAYPYAAPAAYPYAAPYVAAVAGDDGSYFPGKYGPEQQ